MNTNRKLFLVILLLAAALRLYHLGQESIWFDEGWTVRVTRLSPAGVIADAASDVHSPFYYFLMKGWVMLFGASEWSVRFPSVLFGLASVFVLYRLGRLMFNQPTALFAAFLLAVSTLHVRYSQEARSYGLLSLLALGSIYFYWCLLRENRPRLWLGYIFATCPLMYIHNFGMMVLLTQWVYLAGLWLFVPSERQGRRLAWWLGVQALLGVLYLPWAGVLLSQVHMIRQGFWIPPVTLKSLGHAFAEYCGGRGFIALFFVPAVAAFVCYGRVPSRTWTTAQGWGALARRLDLAALPQTLFLALMIWIPNVVPYIVSKLAAPMYTSKSTLYCAPMLYLLVAYATMKLPWRAGRIGVIALLGVLSLVAVAHEERLVRKEPWRDVVRDIEQMAGHGDLVLFNWGLCRDNAFDYYSRRPDLTCEHFPRSDGYTIDDSALAELDTRLHDRDRLWLVLCRSGDKEGRLVTHLRDRMRESFHKFYPGYDEFIEVYRFERPGKGTP